MAARNENAKSADREFTITRVFDAPRELVYRAWTEPKQMGHWWGPHNFTNPVCEMDVRPGGAYRIVMRGPDGVDYPIKGVYREVVRPERLVATVDVSEHPAEWQDLVMPNRAKDDPNPAGSILQTVTFEDQKGRTRVTIRMQFESAAIRDAFVKTGMNEGWSESLDRLAGVLSHAGEK